VSACIARFSNCQLPADLSLSLAVKGGYLERAVPSFDLPVSTDYRGTQRTAACYFKHLQLFSSRWCGDTTLLLQGRTFAL